MRKGEIGRRIRTVRRERALTLRQVAEVGGGVYAIAFRPADAEL
jgi:transcriptional regulator with XRE-family HTH domain